MQSGCCAISARSRNHESTGFFTPAWCPSWTAALINHLWQSTAVVLVAWLLTLLLRANPARVRYAIWMTASIKFLVPFAFLSSFGAHWALPNASPQAGPSLYVIEQFGQPFHQAPTTHPVTAVAAVPSYSMNSMSILFASVWLCGFLAMLIIWVVRWRRAARMTQIAEPVTGGREFDALRLVERNAGIRTSILLLLSPSETEPGVFGLIRPVLLVAASASPIGSTMPRSKRSCLMRSSTCAAAIT